MSQSPTAIVTGATGALGGVVVEHLLSLGWKLAVPYRDERRWRALADRCAAGDRLAGLPCEVAEAGEAARFVDQAVARLGRLDGLALLAGGWSGGRRFDEAPVTELSAMLRANLDSAAFVCHAALPDLALTQGAIVAVGSSAAAAGGSGMAGYAVAKSALHALVRALAAENLPRGIRVNTVLPGTLDTVANREAMPHADRTGWVATLEVARLIALLLSPQSRPITGAALAL